MPTNIADTNKVQNPRNYSTQAAVNSQNDPNGYRALRVRARNVSGVHAMSNTCIYLTRAIHFRVAPYKSVAHCVCSQFGTHSLGKVFFSELKTTNKECGLARGCLVR